jgi:effector-binding domain-containing protein
VYDITFTHESGRRLAVTCYQARPEEIGPKAGKAFAAVAAHLGRARVPMTGPAVSCYTMGPQVFEVASGFVVGEDFEPGDGVEPYRLPPCEVATTTHVGRYEDLGKAYEALREGVAAQGRRLAEDGIMWEEYWSPPGTPADQTKTVISWPVVPAGD